MDDLLDAFLSGKSIPRGTVSGGTTNGRMRTEYEEPEYTEDIVPEPTKIYARPFVEQLKQEVWKVSKSLYIHWFEVAMKLVGMKRFDEFSYDTKKMCLLQHLWHMVSLILLRQRIVFHKHLHCIETT